MASTKSFLSILAGLAAGAAIGILYAPDKGWKTRARVKKAAANGYEDMKENLRRSMKRPPKPRKPSTISATPSAKRVPKSRKAPASSSSSSSSVSRTP